MAHFAQLDENNVVVQVIVVANEYTLDVNGNEVEEIGVAFCKKLLGADTNWKQTSYNGNIRVRYAGIGFSYNEKLDAFISPQPYPSWVLDEYSADWDPPIPYPTLTEEEIASDSYYIWNEESYQIDNKTGWELKTPETQN